MTAFLIGVTLLALGLAGALLFYVLRLSREHRERFEARSAALAGMIGHEPALDTEPPQSDGDSTQSPPALFGGVAQVDRRAGTPWLFAAGAVVVVIALAGTYLLTREGGTAAASGPAPLELVSLGHERAGEALAISGLVRNPHSGRPMNDLVAVVFTFDGQGNYLSSGRAGLDFRQLPPGGESAFSITLPSAAGVARYRVSLRTDDAVIPHVDRRAEPAVTDRGATR